MNYLSRPHAIRQPIEMGGSLQLAMSVANTLQSRYDANKSIVDQTLAQYESLRGLNDTDNAYIASQVSNIKNQINSLGSINLSYNTGRDTILNNMKNVLKNPIVQDILVSKNNKDRYDSEYQETVKKDPSKGNADNYEYGLIQGGYMDYMQGKTKKVGSMSYIPFENVTANQTKRLKEYVEQYDDEQLLQQGAGLEGSKYHTVDIYGKVVLKEDLETFLRQTTTPQEAQQMHINAWSKFKGVDEKEVGTILKPLYENRLKDLKEKEAVIQAKIASGDKTQKKNLTALQEIIENATTKVNKGGFTKNELYSEYNDTLIKDMASLYDKNVITKKDVQDYLFDEAKFASEEKRWALTFDQKERQLELKQKEVDLQQSMANGTLTEYPTVQEDKEESEFNIFNKEKTTAFDSVVGGLSATDPEFAKKTTREKAIYLTNLNLDDPSKIKDKNITPELRNSIIKWQKLNKNSTDFYADNLKTVQPTIIGSFQDMQKSYFEDKGSELDLENVSAYLPNTARVIKDAKKKGKQFSWNDISEDDRYAIQVEFLAQYRREGDLSDDQTKVFATNEYIMKNKIKNKNLVASLNTLNEERGGVEQGFFREGWEGVKSYGSNVGTFFKRAGAGIGNIYDSIKEGSEYADKEAKKLEKDPSLQYDTKGLSGILNFVPQTAVPMFAKKMLTPMFSEEENLRNIESRDLLGRENIGKRFDTYKTNMDAQMKNKFGTESPFQKYQKAVSYSTTIKEQKNTAELIRQTIMATNPDAPIPSGDNYTVKEKEAGFEITYQVKTDKGLEYAEPIFLDRLPPSLQGTFQQKQDEWQKSIYNPNFKIPKFTFETPKTEEEAEKAFDNIVRYGGLDTQTAEDLYKSGMLAPASSYVDYFVAKDVQKRNPKAIENFKNQEFKTNTKIVNGQLFGTLTYKDIETGEFVQTKPKPIYMANEQIETIDVQLTLLSFVNDEKLKQLASLK